MRERLSEQPSETKVQLIGGVPCSVFPRVVEGRVTRFQGWGKLRGLSLSLRAAHSGIQGMT